MLLPQRLLGSTSNTSVTQELGPLGCRTRCCSVQPSLLSSASLPGFKSSPGQRRSQWGLLGVSLFPAETQLRDNERFLLILTREEKPYTFPPSFLHPYAAAKNTGDCFHLSGSRIRLLKEFACLLARSWVFGFERDFIKSLSLFSVSSTLGLNCLPFFK